MAQLGALISFQAGTPAVANDVNYNFNLIRTFINSANFGVDNITGTLASRSGSPILTINQISEPFSPLYIINSQNKSGIQIDQQVNLDPNHGVIFINDTATQSNTTSAGLLMYLSNASINPAILIKHGGSGGAETFKLTKLALSLFDGVLEVDSQGVLSSNDIFADGKIVAKNSTVEYEVNPQLFSAGSLNNNDAKQINWNNGPVQELTLNTSGSVSLSFINPSLGGVYLLKITRGATLNGTLSWPASVKWGVSGAPVLSSAATKVDLISFVYDGTNYYGTYSLGY